MTVEQIKLGAIVRVNRPQFEGRKYKIEDCLLTERGLRLTLRSVDDPDNTRDEKAVECELV